MRHLPYLLSLLLCLLLSTVGYAQTDTLYMGIPAGDERTKEVYEKLNLAGRQARSAPQKALENIESALEISYELQDKRAEAWAYQTLGSVDYFRGKFGAAAEHFQKAITLFSETNEEGGINNAYQNTALAYERANNLGKALEYFLITGQRAERAGNRKAFLQAQKDIARVYYKQGEYALALTRYQTVLKMAQEDQDQESINDAYNNLGTIHLSMADTTQALEFYNLNSVAAQEAQDTVMLVQSYGNMGRAYSSKNNFKEKVYYQEQAAQLNNSIQQRGRQKKNNRNTFQANDGYELAEPLQDANYELAQTYLNNNNSIQAIPILEDAILLTRDNGQLKEEGQAVEALSQAYEDVGDFKKALESYKEYVRIVDSLQALRESEALASNQLSEAVGQREERIELLERSKEIAEKEMVLLKKEAGIQQEGLQRQRMINWMLAVLLLIAAVAGGLIWRSSRRERRANQLLALKSLRSQMNPHFIFNSLNSVNSFIALNDERSANKFLAEFSRLMRAVLDNSKHEFIPLKKEVDILRVYLNLEHFRFKDKFDYEFEVDPALSAEQVMVPPMLIQPYIENAIWHGLRYKEAKGFLNVSLTLEGDQLVCVVQDNGIGRARSRELKTRHQQEHISTGLKNTSERVGIINELYKTRLEVNIDDLHEGGVATGTRVRIEIPTSVQELQSA